MILHTTQNIVASDKHRFRTCCNGRRWGKTTLSIEEIKGKALAKPSRIAYIANTYQQARDIAWTDLKRELQPILISINESRLEIKVRTRDGGESIIILRGWESVETLRGQAFDFVVLDEVAQMKNFWIMWQQVIRPTLTDRKGEGLFISTPKGYNHFYELFSKDPAQQPVEGIDQDEDFKSFHFSSYDNPHLPVEELDKAKKELTEDGFAQEYMADFRKMEGLVYKEFSREKHVYTEKIFHTVDNLVPVDFGFTNPCAILKIQKDTDNNFFVTREWYETGKTTPEIIEIARTFGGNKYYPDPAEPDRIEEMKRAGLNIREVSKDIEAGLNAVRELFKNNRLFIHSSCTHLIDELESYRYPDKKGNRNEPEIPIKEDDHACDALRYALYMQTANTKPAFAHTHYSQSAQPIGLPRNQTPMHDAPATPNQPKTAYVHRPKL